MDGAQAGDGRNTKMVISPGEMVVGANAGCPRDGLSEGYPTVPLTRGWEM